MISRTAAIILLLLPFATRAQLLKVSPSEDVTAATDSLNKRIRQMIDSPDPITDTIIAIQPMQRYVFLPTVYTHYRYFEPFKPFEREVTGSPALRWVEYANAGARNEQMLAQRFMLRYPYMVSYNLSTLPEAPKQYIAKVNPSRHTIDIEEVVPDTPDKMDVFIQKRHWLRTFDASLQFSQAYISPNWYQGGNNNLNFLANIYYNVKLNQVYHPKLLFETTFQYKLGLNNAPDDSLRNYAISEDLLQINTTFGYKAAHKWYYSVNAQFKTQLLNSYVKNSDRLSSALLSPAEFTTGVGMTYNTANKKKTFTFDASISPISYNMKICTKPDSVIRHEDFNIDADKKFSMKFGSSAEAKIMWQMAKNIQFRSRLFVFTDYGYIQGDWENTLAMNINRYLSTQIYAHIRYDSTTPRCEDRSWHKLQVKEILSFGVSYRFSSI